MDNANYSKETAKAMETKSFVKELEEITPTTCFDSYSVSDLLKLCESYRDRVLQSGKSEDVEILLNINTVRTFQLFQCRPYRQSYQTHQKTLPRDHPIHVFSFSSYSHRFESSDPRGLSHRRAASIGCEQGGRRRRTLGKPTRAPLRAKATLPWSSTFPRFPLPSLLLPFLSPTSLFPRFLLLPSERNVRRCRSRSHFFTRFPAGIRSVRR